MPQLKICGLKHSAQAAAIAELGVEAIGVIAVSGSPRYVPPLQRPELFAAASGANPNCAGVLVVADPADHELDALQASRGHRVVQLHGAETPERCEHLRGQLSGVALWKALRIRSPQDLDQVALYTQVVDAVLLDAWAPGALGGTGQQLPLDWLDGFEPQLPWWLAGGICAATAGAALQRLRPDGLDASSALETSPGIKDLERVRQLLAVVSAARQDQGH
ncbi:MAG: phosphoribosylanthranilate isomerase [Prochlorococcaceae cyanobacterium]|jgi:phosphoribosylanthranilate isomerase